MEKIIMPRVSTINKIAKVNRTRGSKRPIINEKRENNNNPNFKGLSVENAKELARLLETRDKRTSIQRKKSAIGNKRVDKFQY
ncbi:MAG TPA: hypothetical protein PK685_00010 [archaeon]|nr:hypothetical protein [archaeon]